MKQLWSLVAVAAIALGAPALAQDAAKPAAKPSEKQVQPAQDWKKEGKKVEAKNDKVELKIGEKAPEFTLKDTEGKEHSLSSGLTSLSGRETGESRHRSSASWPRPRSTRRARRTRTRLT